jgi:hypothetical protein
MPLDIVAVVFTLVLIRGPRRAESRRRAADLADADATADRASARRRRRRQFLSNAGGMSNILSIAYMHWSPDAAP